MTWTPIQLDYRARIWVCLQEHTYARATIEGLSRIFPPSQRVVERDPVDRCDRYVTKTTTELLAQCLAEVGILIDDVSPGATPPFSIGIIRFRLANDPR